MSTPDQPAADPAPETTPAETSAVPQDGAGLPGTPLLDPEHPERPAGVGPEEEARWKPWSAWLALLTGLVGALFGGAAVALVAGATGADLKDAPPWVDIASTVVQDISLIGAALLFANMITRPKPWQFGLRPPERLVLAVGWFVLAYVAFIVFSAVWISALGLENTKDTLPDKLGAKDSDVLLIAVAFLVCVIAPVTEEFFFRGFFFRAVANWRGMWPAAVITGLVFGGIHAAGSPVGFLVPLAFLGFLLCVLYAKTKSLLPPIVLHCVNNCFAYGSAVGWGWEIGVALAASLAIIFAGLAVIRRITGPPPGPARPIVAMRQA